MKRMANRIHAAKVLLGKLFIDNRYLRRPQRIVLVEFTPCDQARSHRAEITRPRSIEKSIFFAFGSRRSIRTHGIVPPVSANWCEADLRRRDHPGNPR